MQAPHPFITRGRLRAALAPSAGERILEIGPGTGYYTLDVATQVGAGGTIEIVDIQQEMLDHTLRRARERGLQNLLATSADARSLPFQDGRFDAAYLVTVLGEIPDQDAALREVARVLRPGGRLVVGELFGDPHFVRFAALGGRAQRAGLDFQARIGGPLAYFAIFTRPSPDGPSPPVGGESSRAP